MRVNENLIFDKSKWTEGTTVLFDAVSKHVPDGQCSQSDVIDGMLRIAFSSCPTYLYIPKISTLQELNELIDLAKNPAEIKLNFRKKDKCRWPNDLLNIQKAFKTELEALGVSKELIADSLLSFLIPVSGLQYYLGTHDYAVRQLKDFKLLSDYNYSNASTVSMKYFTTTHHIYRLAKSYAKKEKEARA